MPDDPPGSECELLLMALELRPVRITKLGSRAWPEVSRIYTEGIATGDATFETEVPGWDRWDASHLREHRFIALHKDNVLGWVAAARVSDRCVYAGVVEHSVYVAANERGKGVGRRLLERFILSTEAAGIWTIQTGIFPENEASLALHERVGFRIVGRRERLGKHNGVWRDVLMLERRSGAVD